MQRRFRWGDLLFAAAFLTVGGIVWLQSRPTPVGELLARQALTVARAEAALGDLPFLPPPGSPEEAAALRSAWDAFLASAGPPAWKDLRAALAQRGKPETVSAFQGLAADEEAARNALGQALAALAQPDPKEAGMAAKRSADYLDKANGYQAAASALDAWVVRLSADDFK